MLAAALGARVAGPHDWLSLASWQPAARVGLSLMFLFTGAAHFTRTRRDLIRMAPPFVPNPALAVTLTGVAELAGALGLLFQPTARWAALGLVLLLVAMFPANVHAARAGHLIEGRRHMPIVPRTALQAGWMILLIWCTWAR